MTTNNKDEKVISLGSMILYCLMKVETQGKSMVRLMDVIDFSNLIVAFLGNQGQNYRVDSSVESLNGFFEKYPTLSDKIIRLKDDDEDVAYLKHSRTNRMELNKIIKETLPFELRNVLFAPQFEGVGLLKTLSR